MRTFSVVSIPLLSELSWCQHSSAVRIFLVSAFLRCQNFPGVSISSAVRIFLVSVFLRCQDFLGVRISSAVRIILVSAFLRCQLDRESPAKNNGTAGGMA
jgi:hypothetical protein